MSLTTQQKQPSDRDKLRGQLDRMTGEFRVALPDHIPAEKFKRVVLTAVQQNPDLMVADRKSLLMAATKCATDGLLPDSREAAFVIFNTKVKIKFTRPDETEGQREEWVKLVQYMPMRAGVQKRAYNTGMVLSLQGHVIHQNDHFIWSQGTDEKLEHKPLFPGDRGQPIGVYAVAHIKGQDRPLFRVMDRARIDKARAISRSKDGPAWTQWWDEMAIKTVIRNLAKDLPAGAEIEEIARRDDEAPLPDESTDTIDGVLADEPQQIAAPNKLDALEGIIVESGDSGVQVEDLDATNIASMVARVAEATSLAAVTRMKARTNAGWKAEYDLLSDAGRAQVDAAIEAREAELLRVVS